MLWLFEAAVTLLLFSATLSVGDKCELVGLHNADDTRYVLPAQEGQYRRSKRSSTYFKTEDMLFSVVKKTCDCYLEVQNGEWGCGETKQRFSGLVTVTGEKNKKTVVTYRTQLGHLVWKHFRKTPPTVVRLYPGNGVEVVRLLFDEYGVVFRQKKSAVQATPLALKLKLGKTDPPTDGTATDTSASQRSFSLPYRFTTMVPGLTFGLPKSFPEDTDSSDEQTFFKVADVGVGGFFISLTPQGPSNLSMALLKRADLTSFSHLSKAVSLYERRQTTVDVFEVDILESDKAVHLELSQPSERIDLEKRIRSSTRGTILGAFVTNAAEIEIKPLMARDNLLDKRLTAAFVAADAVVPSKRMSHLHYKKAFDFGNGIVDVDVSIETPMTL